MPDDWTKFPPIGKPSKSTRGLEPMMVGLLGPPGSGKTRSMLRMMRGAQRVFPGPMVLIDTEAGRSRKFSPREGEKANPDHPTEATYDFERIDLGPPFRGDRCWEAIKMGLAMKPAAIGFDNLSDEHVGEGGYLDFHDKEIERMGGNEWGAWGRPSACRKKLISGISHVAAPPILFFTFIAEEKTAQVEEVDQRTGRNRKKIINKGWTPVAPLLILKTLDITCILPWDSKGTPIWESRKLPGEDFIRKWPDHLVALLSQGQLTEDHGEALARWAAGTTAQAPPAGAGATKGAREALLAELGEILAQAPDQAAKKAILAVGFPSTAWKEVQVARVEVLQLGLDKIRKHLAEVEKEDDPSIDQDQVFEILGLARAAGIDSARLPEMIGCQPHQLPVSRFEEVKALLVGNPADVPSPEPAQAMLGL